MTQPTVKYFLTLALVFINLFAYSQLSYNDLVDLNTIAKKEDFAAVKNFLQNKGFLIQEFNTNYDHGSYYVIGHIKAKKPIGTHGDGDPYNTNVQNGDIFDEIEMNLEEYNDYKKLTLYQKIFTDKEYQLVIKKLEPLNQWYYENWTSVTISTDQKEGFDFIGDRSGDFNFEDTSLTKIKFQTLRDYVLGKDLSDKRTYIYLSFMNSNPLMGELKYNTLTYQAIMKKYFRFNLLMWTKILKGKNVAKANDKHLEIPLIKSGKTYLVTLKFGNLVKTYILDSGASDMSVDEETFQYFDNSNQLKIENRLTDAKYQLADGSMVQLKRIRIPAFSINDIIVKNIDATIVQNGKPLLLGKSFLDSFKSWKIDNEAQKLVVELF